MLEKMDILCLLDEYYYMRQKTNNYLNNLNTDSSEECAEYDNLCNKLAEIVFEFERRATNSSM